RVRTGGDVAATVPAVVRQRARGLVGATGGDTRGRGGFVLRCGHGNPGCVAPQRVRHRGVAVVRWQWPFRSEQNFREPAGGDPHGRCRSVRRDGEAWPRVAPAAYRSSGRRRYWYVDGPLRRG